MYVREHRVMRVTGELLRNYYLVRVMAWCVGTCVPMTLRWEPELVVCEQKITVTLGKVVKADMVRKGYCRSVYGTRRPFGA